MTYNPTFTYSPLGNYSEQNAFISAVGATDGYVMENELNEFQWIFAQQRAKEISELFGSGSFSKGTDSVSNGTLTIAPRDALVMGHILKLVGTSANSGNLVISLPAAPTSGTRQDLVYLVMYLTEVNYQSTIYKNGYLQGDTVTNNLLDSRVNAETMRRVQKQWTIKTASGVTTLTDASLGYTATAWDSHLYTKSNANTVDGVEYAIPLYLANRTYGSPDTLTDDAYYIKNYATVGQANGLASLDTNGHVPSGQITSANLPVATASVPGVVSAGSGISVDSGGSISTSASALGAAITGSTGNTFTGDQTIQKNTPAIGLYDTSTGGTSWRLIANGSNGLQLQHYNGSAWIVLVTFDISGDMAPVGDLTLPSTTPSTAAGTLSQQNNQLYMGNGSAAIPVGSGASNITSPMYWVG